jgi:hypothetical protein
MGTSQRTCATDPAAPTVTKKHCITSVARASPLGANAPTRFGNIVANATVMSVMIGICNPVPGSIFAAYAASAHTTEANDNAYDPFKTENDDCFSAARMGSSPASSSNDVTADPCAALSLLLATTASSSGGFAPDATRNSAEKYNALHKLSAAEGNRPYER